MLQISSCRKIPCKLLLTRLESMYFTVDSFRLAVPKKTWPSPIINGLHIIGDQQSITHGRARRRLSSVPYLIRTEFEVW
jgi:hypothetical protein